MSTSRWWCDLVLNDLFSTADVESGHKRQETFTESAFNVVISLAKFGLILLYTFLADRHVDYFNCDMCA